MCCSVLLCVAVCSLLLVDTILTLQHTATHCNTLQHTATHSNTLQHTATHCNTLQRAVRYFEYYRSHSIRLQCNSALQRVATCCSVLQRVAACCSLLQCDRFFVYYRTHSIRLHQNRKSLPLILTTAQ